MAEFDNLFEQMSNISKASAYDILVPEIVKLKEQNAVLLEACGEKDLKDYTNTYGCVIQMNNS